MSGIHPHEDPPDWAETPITSDDDPQVSRRRALDRQRTTGKTGSLVMAAILVVLGILIVVIHYNASP